MRAGLCAHVKQLLGCLKDSEKKQNLGSEGKRDLLNRDQEIIQNASSHLMPRKQMPGQQPTESSTPVPRWHSCGPLRYPPKASGFPTGEVAL